MNEDINKLILSKLTAEITSLNRDLNIAINDATSPSDQVIDRIMTLLKAIATNKIMAEHWLRINNNNLSNTTDNDRV